MGIFTVTLRGRARASRAAHTPRALPTTPSPSASSRRPRPPPRPRAARRTRRELSQNFLRSRRLAADIVRGLDVEPHELIVEIGAGDGRLTAELARRARHVIGIEL